MAANETVSPSRYVSITTRSQSLMNYEFMIIAHHQGRYDNVLVLGRATVYWIILCIIICNENTK